MTAFERGWDAAERGLLPASCPYHRASGEAIAWHNGWIAFYKHWGIK